MLLIESVIINFVLDRNSTLKDQNQGYRNRYDCENKKIHTIVTLCVGRQAVAVCHTLVPDNVF